MAENFGLSVEDVTIRCDIPNHSAEETLALLKKLNCNRQLRKLFLESSSSMFACEDDDDTEGYITPLIKSLGKIIETSNRLEALSLGCIDIRTSISTILKLLSQHHAKHLKTLCLASIRDDPNKHNFVELDYERIFNPFVRLSILTLDYEFVNDSLLKALDSGRMERLVIHVHGWNYRYLGTSDSAWRTFAYKK